MTHDMHVPPPGMMTRWCSIGGSALGGVLGFIAAVMSVSADWPFLSFLMIIMAPLAAAAIGLLLGAIVGFLMDWGSSSVWMKEVERGAPVPTRAGGPRWGMSALPST